MENKQRNGLSKTLKTFFGVGDFGFSFMTNIESFYFNYFLTNVAQFALPVVTMITTVASTVDAALSWIYGAIINSAKPMKWGRYRSWLIAVPWIVPFLYAFQFIKIGNDAVGAVVIIVATCVSHFAWNIPFVANTSMIRIAAKTPEERMQLSSTRAVWQSLGRVCYSYIGPGVVAFLAGIIGEKNSYAAAAFVFGALMAALYFAHFKMFEGYEDISQEVNDVGGDKKADKGRTSGGDLIKSLFGNPSLIFLMISELAKYMYSFIVNGIAVYYFTYVAQNAGLLATYILISNILGVVGSYMSKHVAKKFSARTTVIMAYIFMIVFLFASYLTYTNVVLVILFMSIVQLCCASTNACSPALYADAALYSEWKTGKNATGWVMGLLNVPLKVGIISRGIVISACLAMANFDPNIDPSAASPELMRGICNGFMLIPAVATVIGVVVMVLGYRLTREKIAQYQAEVDARNKA